MNKKKNTKPKSDINVPNTIKPGRTLPIFIFIFILMIALIIRVGYLQLVDGERLLTLATSQQTLTETLSAKRGTIYDSTGNVLAISYESDKVYINPTKIEDTNKQYIAQSVSSILELDSTELLAKLNSSTSRFVLAKNVEKEKIEELKNWLDKQSELKIVTGISIEASTSRFYPSGSLASTVLGFVGADNQGSYGIELSWNDFLSGTSGKSVSLKDASQSEIVNSEQSYIAAENGYDITLTIDTNIQSIVEKHLAEAVEQYQCESGITIAMDPSTGKILAMADYPNYDCNNKDTPNAKLAENWDTLTSEEKNTAIVFSCNGLEGRRMIKS